MHQRTLIATSVTLASLAHAVDADERPFVLTGQWAHGHTIAGSAPVRSLPPTEDPFTALDDLPHVADETSELTFGGGWVGHLGFELGRTIETLPPQPPTRGATASAHGMAFYDHALVLDPEGRCWFEHLALPGRAAEIAARLDTLRARLSAGDAEAVPARVTGLALNDADADAHRDAIAAVLARIGAGEIFQANLCLRLRGTLDGSPLAAWLSLMTPKPAAYGAYLRDGDQALLSCSPELFLRRTGRTVVSLPMKGTRPRTERDDVAAAELATAPKDGAENVMIVDLMRNDLGRVCQYGSIRVDPAEVQPHPGVWQLVRRVSGTLRPEVGDAELVRSCFPPGSVVGAPKIQALKVIAAEESAARGAHCGAIGYASPYAGLAMNVAIRTLEIDGALVSLGVGGGIVADSDPDSEVAECEVKAAPLRAALGIETTGAETAQPDHERPRAQSESRIRSRPALPALLADGRSRPDPANGLLETIALSDGRPQHLDRHVARLKASAQALYGSHPDLIAPCAEVDALAQAGAIAARIVAVANATGWTVTVTARPAPALTPTGITLTPVTLPGGLGPHKWADRSTLAEPPPSTTWLLCDRTGEVLEAAWANLWIREGTSVSTPPADGRLLPGIGRALILANPALVDATTAHEARLTLARIRAADGCFLTSALRIVEAHLATPVAESAAVLAAGYHR